MKWTSQGQGTGRLNLFKLLCKDGKWNIPPPPPPLKRKGMVDTTIPNVPNCTQVFLKLQGLCFFFFFQLQSL